MVRHACGVSFFITGTDTGAGKTWIARHLIASLRDAGVDAVGYKPVACGDRDDGKQLAEASGGLDLDVVNPVWFKTPVAPHVAGMLENRTVDPAVLVRGFQALSEQHRMVLVEGVGGWEVPISPGFFVSDLAVALGLPVIVVVDNRLGALNHAILTVRAIQARGLVCAGLVVNQTADEFDAAMITNRGLFGEFTGVPVLAHVIHGQDFLDVDPFLDAVAGV
jgi:dethiobiotin synthetase